jgi:superfamily II DNA or RNA helicase
VSEKRRLTNSKERHALYLAADGKCEMCRITLPDNWHADHIVPFSVTKQTHYTEMQALCPSCNTKKGAKIMGKQILTLRQHQQILTDELDNLSSAEFNEAVRTKNAFLILANVVPGGGKTKLATILAKAFYKMNVLVLVPRLTLAKQIDEAFNAEGIEAIAMVNGWENNPSKGTRGVICSHSMASRNAANLGSHMARSGKDWVVIIDECHHLRKNKAENTGDDTDLGGNISGAEIRKYILPKAKVIMRMSGTFSTRNDLIDGVHYEERIVGDSSIYDPNWQESADIYIDYTRKQALKEQAIVPVKFYHMDGEAKFTKDGELDEQKLSVENERDARNVLFAALKTEFADQMVINALDNYKTYVKSFPQAKMIIVCTDQPKADLVKKLVQRQSRFNVYLAITDNPNSLDEIEQFKADKSGSILVTVAMAYEGLDVPDVSHLVGLTYYRSDGWIHQMFGRAWRKTDWKKLCHIWVPDDLMMNRIIKQIRDEQIELTEIRAGGERAGGTGGGGERSLVPLESEATDLHAEHLDAEAGIEQSTNECMEVLSSQFGISNSRDKLRKLVEDALRDQVGVKTKVRRFDELTATQKYEYLRNKIKDWCRRTNEGEHGKAEKQMLIRYWPNGIGTATLDMLHRAWTDIINRKFRV